MSSPKYPRTKAASARTLGSSGRCAAPVEQGRHWCTGPLPGLQSSRSPRALRDKAPPRREPGRNADPVLSFARIRRRSSTILRAGLWADFAALAAMFWRADACSTDLESNQRASPWPRLSRPPTSSLRKLRQRPNVDARAEPGRARARGFWRQSSEGKGPKESSFNFPQTALRSRGRKGGASGEREEGDGATGCRIWR